MVPTPYSRLAGDDEDAGLQQQQQQRDAAPLPAQPPILFGSTTSLPSSTTSYWDDLEGKDRFDAEDELEDGRDRGGPSHWRARPSSKSDRRRPIIIIGSLLVFALLVGSLAAGSWRAPFSRMASSTVRQHLTLDHVMNDTFSPKRTTVDWNKEAGDGIFSTRDKSGNLYLEDVTDRNSTKLLLNATLVVDPFGKRIEFSDWALSPDMHFVLLKSDKVQQWRWSSHANVWVHCLIDGTTYPVAKPAYPPTIAYATWAPVGHGLAFVDSNDLYVLPDEAISGKGVGKPIRVTTDGTTSVFNGVPDWVYEEEVFSADSALWFSPTGQEIAFLRSDETDVPTFEYPVYDPDPSTSEVKPYPKEVVMKYPKPGYSNPLVTVHLFSLPTYKKLVDVAFATDDVTGSQAVTDLSWPGMLPQTNQVLFEVAWIEKAGRKLLVKEADRSAANGQVVVFDIDGDEASSGMLMGSVVRELSGGQGWIEESQNVKAYAQGYLDVLPTPEGFNHIAYFASNVSVPVWITEGAWEISNGIEAIDLRRGLVYFTAANPSIERHIYSATLPLPTLTQSELFSFKPKVTPLTDASRPGYYSASFSSKVGYYVLSSLGPEVPYQQIVSIENKKFNYVLETNKELNATLNSFILPTTNQLTVISNGYELNVKEIRPPNMDESGKTKYPLLLAPYGGPGSQSVDVRFSLSWAHYLAAELKYVVLVVDGRGTGFKGRDLRNPVRGKLGQYEAEDQIEVARQWAAEKKYVSRARVGIWGWSFGGYLAAKVLEADSGIVSLGISVAPVTDWRFYDSIYTERYMLTPDENEAGYKQSGVNNVTAFHHADYLLAHGSGDDNVHYANSASLIEKFTLEKVRRYEFRMFSDSNHSMNKYTAYRELHEFMTTFLFGKWGKGGARRGW